MLNYSPTNKIIENCYLVEIINTDVAEKTDMGGGQEKKGIGIMLAY